MKRANLILPAVIITGIVLAGVLFLPQKKNEGQIQPPALENFVNQSLRSETQSLQEPIVKSSQEKKAEELKPVTDVCTGLQASDFGCYEKYFQEAVQRQGIAPTFAVLRSTYNNNSYVKSQCHPIVHVIGRAATDKFSDVADAYAQGDPFCWSGYYHGVMEGIVAKIGYENVVSKMNGICKGIAAKQRYSFDHYNCVHGLGHGVMALTNTELFKSLEMCDQGLTDPWDRSSCHSGAFMENIIVDNKNHVTKYLKPSDPLYPCNAVAEQYKTTCYLMQTSYMLKVNGYDFKKVFALCRQVEEHHKATCFQSLGRDASGNSISNVEQTKATCQLGADYFEQSNCLVGAVKDFISYYHSDQQAKELCNAVNSDLRDVCLATVGSYYASF